MKLLLDTQIALWSIMGDPKLGARADDLIHAAEYGVYASAASVWEIAIKHKLQRGSPNDMPLSGTQARDAFEAAGFTLLAITSRHAAAVDTLPLLHGDPFDRLLVAQALTEPMRLLTRDARLAAYGALVMMV